ncbi:unnamed protein product [Arctia plantaginis]|uniref:Uncharacterized protein n=1 Tax=Arctia plantaginis TaxID=874455 RepID=A0A8S1ARN7_ARCPL|nr:unnamed protein product [Arctia plantaginis]
MICGQRSPGSVSAAGGGRALDSTYVSLTGRRINMALRAYATCDTLAFAVRCRDTFKNNRVPVPARADLAAPQQLSDDDTPRRAGEPTAHVCHVKYQYTILRCHAYL